MSDEADDRGALTVVLVVVLATGMVDAASLLHLGVFTAYMTGSLVLFGAHLVGTPGSPWPSAGALAAFVGGLVVGALLVRRTAGRHRLVGDVLVLVALVVAVAAGLAAWRGVDSDGGRYLVTAVLAVGMGSLIAAVHTLRVPEVPMAAGTLATFGVITGLLGDPDASHQLRRRVAVIVALVVGAMVGAALARWEPWGAWAMAAVVIAVAATAAYRLLPREPSSG